MAKKRFVSALFGASLLASPLAASAESLPAKDPKATAPTATPPAATPPAAPPVSSAVAPPPAEPAAPPAAPTAPAGAAPAPTEPPKDAAPAPAPASAPATSDAPPPLAGPAAAPVPAPASAPAAPTPAPAGRTRNDQDYEKGGPADTQGLVEVKEQPKLNVALTWNVTLPLGKTQDFASSVSLQGFSIEIRYRLAHNYQIGALIGWASLSEKIYSSTSKDGVALQGTQLNEFSTNPIIARLHYFFGPAPLIGPNGRPTEGKLRPFVAGGVGAARSLQSVNRGIIATSVEAWQFALVPEIGAIYPLAPADIILGARLGYLVASGNMPEQLFATFAAGVALE